MSRGKSIVGVLVLFALAVGVFGASSASAKAWYTCEEVAPNTGGFTDSHCTKKGIGNWSTIKIKSFPTLVVRTNTITTKISATIGGTSVEISCAEINGESNLTGEETEGEAVDVFSGCEVISPAKCKVSGGGFTTAPLHTTVVKAGEEEPAQMKEAPESGTTIATITLEGCENTAFNKSFPLTGSAIGEVPLEEPSSLSFSGTAGGALKFGGQTATFVAKIHRRMFGSTGTVAFE